MTFISFFAMALCSFEQVWRANKKLDRGDGVLPNWAYHTLIIVGMPFGTLSLVGALLALL